MPQAVQPWRDAWAQQAQHLRDEEERNRPIRAHQQAGIEGQKAWEQILRCCIDCIGLKRLAPEIQRQSQEFADLPEVMQVMQQLWSDRWQELSEGIAQTTAQKKLPSLCRRRVGREVNLKRAGGKITHLERGVIKADLV